MKTDEDCIAEMDDTEEAGTPTSTETTPISIGITILALAGTACAAALQRK